MSKIDLGSTAGGYNLTVINDNFEKIENALNNEVLYRDVPVGEPNAMSNDLDMNSHRVYNLPEPLSPSEAARLQDVQNAIAGISSANLVTFSPSGGISATNVQAAIEEVVSDAAADATTKVNAHINDTTDAHQASAVGFIPAGTGAVATDIGTRSGLEVWSKDFGHLPAASAATNDAALVAAMTKVYNAGGGRIRIASGTYQHISVVFNWAASITIDLIGQGQKAVYLQKNGATSSPVLDFSANIGVLDIYTTVSDFTIVGNAKGNLGFKATRLASISTRNLGIQTCDVGFESIGCLVAIHERPEWQSNNIGFRCRKNTAGGNIFCNLVSFKGGSIRGNSTFGVDIGDASGVSYDGIKIDLNGTAANTATGGAMVRSTVADENGYSQLQFNNTYFESNLGRTFQTENVTGICDLTLTNVLLLGAESNRSANIGTLHNVTMINVQAPGVGDTVVIGACSGSYIEGGVINTITDSSVQQTRINVGTSAGLTPASIKTLAIGTGGLKVDPTATISDTVTSFTQGNVIATFRDGALSGNTLQILATNGVGGNAAGCQVRTGTQSVTGRSINAGGTINAAGADYAEYETKRDDCGVFEKGDVVGFDNNGLLTDKWSKAITFGIKSTNPSYVGGDGWGVGLSNEEIEIARQKVDRIAYSGKVPVNLYNASPGQFVYAASTQSDGIVASLIDNGTPIGRVRSLLEDGRALVVVRM